MEFVCQVSAQGEVPDPPEVEHYAFGTLVAVATADADADLVGIIFDTILFNPDFGSAGPRLRPSMESGILTPDRYVDTATLVGILALGTLRADGTARHGVASTSPYIGATVRVFEDDEVRAFHMDGGQFSVGYVPHLLAHAHPLIGELLLTLSHQLESLFPDESAALSVIRSNLAWQLKVQPAR